MKVYVFDKKTGKVVETYSNVLHIEKGILNPTLLFLDSEEEDYTIRDYQNYIIEIK